MRFTLPVTLAWALVLAAGWPAVAQVRCLSSFPGPGSRLEGPPRSVLLWMNEPVDPQLSRFQVVDVQGRRFDLPARVSADGLRVEVPLRPLPDGVYVVHYRAASVLNGHVAVGLYSFGVQSAPPSRASGLAPLLWAAGALLTVAAAASGSAWAAALATATTGVEWAQAATSAVPAPWRVLISHGWAGVLLATLQPGWSLLLGAAVTGVWAIPARPPHTLLRLVAGTWLWLATPLVAAAGGPLSMLASSHGPALVLMLAAYGVVGLLAAAALPILGVRLPEPPWTRLVVSFLLAAAWAIRPAGGVAEFFAGWVGLCAACTAAYLWSRTRGEART
ncbi:MAG: copper resistance protein CopC [Armatimonadota bacterium]|nr:copper resistance protein CopC [Armatimonadota bacterium]MDW8156238.1 copper resistance protein CopC [Armatimonadota bacterium]